MGVISGIVIDPTTAFTMAVAFLPLYCCTSVSEAIAYVTQKMFVLSFVYLGLVVHLVHKDGKTVPLSKRDLMVANWFLMNGVYFNLFLDVVSGQFQSMGLMSKLYLRVEPRYAHGPMKDEGMAVFWTSMCELFFQSPICLMLYFAYHRGKAWRRPLEIVLCLLHACGVWWFYFPEVGYFLYFHIHLCGVLCNRTAYFNNIPLSLTNNYRHMLDSRTWEDGQKTWKKHFRTIEHSSFGSGFGSGMYTAQYNS